jgi:hypothetical protein
VPYPPGQSAYLTDRGTLFFNGQIPNPSHVGTKAIVWKYQETRLPDFFSPRLSNAQRLANGNTLINEGWFGRFFEVTRDGDVVWEHVNPYFGARQRLVVNAVQRAYRYTAEDIARARAAT